MVPEQINQCETVDNEDQRMSRRYPWILFGIAMSAMIIAFTICAILAWLNPQIATTDEEDVPISQDEPVEEPEPLVIPEIDFQTTVENWANAIGGSKGIIIYDLELDKIVGAYNADQKFQTASLYKIFVVYEGYRRIQNGTFDSEEIIGWTRRTLTECLDLAIRESNSACAETIWNMIGHDELDEIVQTDFNLPGMRVSGLAATPTEIMQMMKIFYEHEEISDEALVARIKDSFLNQPITEYNWRQGLPSGFSERVNVYNKVGWNWNGEWWTIYDDAAILDFVNENRHFIAVVMTSGVTYQQIRNFGAQIEATFYDQNVLKN